MVSGEDFIALCERHGLRLDASALVYHSHWLTPPGLPKRFDTRFFVARAPNAQVPRADEGEALEIAWLTPAEALNPAARRKLLPVTRRTLQDLARFATVQACLDEAATRRHPPRTMPRMGRDANGVRPVLPDEWAWAEIGRLDPDGPIGWPPRAAPVCLAMCWSSPATTTAAPSSSPTNWRCVNSCPSPNLNVFLAAKVARGCFRG